MGWVSSPPIFGGVKSLATVRTTSPSTIGCGTPITSASDKSKCVSSLTCLSFYAILQTALPKAATFYIDCVMPGRAVTSVTYSTVSSQVLNCCFFRLRYKIVLAFFSEWQGS